VPLEVSHGKRKKGNKGQRSLPEPSGLKREKRENGEKKKAETISVEAPKKKHLRDHRRRKTPNKKVLGRQKGPFEWIPSSTKREKRKAREGAN